LSIKTLPAGSFVFGGGYFSCAAFIEYHRKLHAAKKGHFSCDHIGLFVSPKIAGVSQKIARITLTSNIYFHYENFKSGKLGVNRRISRLNCNHCLLCVFSNNY
jgi:hypothetical protein